MKKILETALFAAAAFALPTSYAAEEPIVIGASIAQTGPASSLGSGEVIAMNMLAKQINDKGGIEGHPLKLIIQDSASDPQKDVLNVRKMITGDNAVGIICCTTSPESLAIIDTVQRAKVSNISVAASASIVQPVAERHWIFKTPPLDSVMVKAEVNDMKQRGLKTAGFIGFSDAYGKGGLTEFEKAAAEAGIKITSTEQFSRTDTNVSAQAAKLVNASPDTILVWAIPPGANVAQKALLDAGYKGAIYQSYGVTNDTFLRLGGDGINGTRTSALPVIAYNDLPDSLPFKPMVEKFVAAYRAAADGKVPSSFAGHGYDAVLIYAKVAGDILRSGKVKLSDIEGFRAALRDGIENLKEFQAVDGTFNFSKDDHVGLGPASAVMITFENGKYKVLKN